MPRSELGPEFSLAKRLSDLEAKVRGLTTRDVLQNASISSGGLQILNGGSLTVDGDATFNGSLTVPAGSLNTGGNLTAGGSITAGTSLNGASLAVGGAGSFGSVSAGSVAVTTTLSTGGNISTGGFLLSPAGPTFDITTGRLAAWWRTADGLLAYASSSMFVKTRPQPSGIDPLAMLQIEDVLYNYLAEIRKRDDPSYADYVGPNYHVRDEIGVIAEQLHALGLWQFVDYETEPDPEFPELWSDAEHDDDGNVTVPPVLLRGSIERTKLHNGEPIPRSVHYPMLAVGLLPVVRMLAQQIADLRTEIGDLRGGLG